MLTPEAIIGLVALLVMCAPAGLIIYRRLAHATRQRLSKHRRYELYQHPGHGAYDLEHLPAHLMPPAQRQHMYQCVRYATDPSYLPYHQQSHAPTLMGLVKVEIGLAKS